MVPVTTAIYSATIQAVQNTTGSSHMDRTGGGRAPADSTTTVGTSSARVEGVVFEEASVGGV